MISLNEFINNTNLNKANSIQNNQTKQSKVEEKYDFFEKENKIKKQNNKKRNIIIASTVAILLAFLAILKRNDISKLFNKQPQVPMKPLEADAPIKSKPFERLFELYETDFSAVKEMQQAFNDLTIRKDDKALNCGVGFISESLEKRQKAMNAFVNELNKEGYETVKIPTIHETLPDKIAEAIQNAKNKAIEKFHQTGKRSVLVIRDMDILASKSDDNFNICVGAIKDLEDTKKDGVAWVWDAAACDKIYQPIFGKRTTHKIKLDKIIDKK